jgi:hypothetical protein
MDDIQTPQKPSDKIPFLQGGRITLKRKRTNDEIMRESVQKKGYIALRLFPQIYGVDGKTYGYRGVSWSLKVPTIADANKLVKAIDKFLESLK